MKSPFLALISLALAAVAQEPPAPQLVKDIYSMPAPSSAAPHNFCVVGDTLYYNGKTTDAGKELWKTNGTAEGTALVKDINPGTAEGNPAGMIAVGNTIYFAATDSAAGTELWKSDGTETGTVMVKDIAATGSSSPQSFGALGDKVYFAASSTGTSFLQLWVSDGTEAGTTEAPYPAQLNFPKDFTKVGDILFFTAEEAGRGRELFKATAAGVELVVDRGGPDTSILGSLFSLNGIVYYSGYAGYPSEIGLFRSDGTEAGSYLVKVASDFAGIFHPQVLGNTLYFACAGNLWKSDGTEAGTVMVKTFGPTYEDGISMISAAGGKLYLRVHTQETGVELWVSDGSTEGTVLVIDMVRHEQDSFPQSMMELGDKLYFFASQPTPPHGTCLWRTDGTAAGTSIVKELYTPGETGGISVRIGNKLYFQAIDRNGSHDLWRSDGTTAGTVPVGGMPREKGNADPEQMVAFRGGVVFTANDGEHGHEPWFAPATGTDAFLLADIHPGTNHSYAEGLTVVGDLLYFTARPTYMERGLYVTDGTPQGTQLVKILPALEAPTEMAALGDMLIFSYNDDIHGTELWCSRGTAPSTGMLKNISTVGASAPMKFTEMNGMLYFLAFEEASGRELWRTDGTAAGTTLVKDIYPGIYTSANHNLVVMNGMLYFAANDGVHGLELWKSDGTETGTELVKDLMAGSAGSELAELVAAKGRVFFQAITTATGRELGTSDGTPAGTMMIDSRPGTTSSNPMQLTAFGSKVFYSASVPFQGQEPWVSDGTPGGTFQVKDINVVQHGSSQIKETVAVDGRVYFIAEDDTYGERIWRSDGTTAGTAIYSYDLKTPTDIVFSGTRLFFAATSDEAGTELFSAPEGKDLDIRVGTGTEWIPKSDTLAVGSPLAGVPAAPVTVTLRNHGWHPIDLSEVTRGGPQAAEFQITMPGDLSLPRTLQRGESVELTVLFTPAATGVRSATLRILSTDYDEPDRTVTLLGFGNTAPLFSGHQVTGSTNPVVILRAAILADATDADGDQLSVSLPAGASAQGGRTDEYDSVILYYPPPGLSGSDSFSVIIDDGHGQSVSGTVTVIIPEGGLVDLGLTRPRMDLLDGDNRGVIRFKGIPGLSYRILRSTDLKVWKEVEVKTLGQDGVFDWDDVEAPYPRAFYQIEGPGF